MAFIGSHVLMDPHFSQQHAGLYLTVLQLKQKVNKSRFKPSLLEKSEVDGGANRLHYFCQLYLVRVNISE